MVFYSTKAVGTATLPAGTPGVAGSIDVALATLAATDRVVITLSGTALQTVELAEFREFNFQVVKTASTGFTIYSSQEQNPELTFDYVVLEATAGLIEGAITIGEDGTGYDVKFFGDTAGSYMLWDESADELILAGTSKLTVAGVINPDGGITFDAGASDLANPLMMDAIGDTTTAVVSGALGSIIKMDAASAVTHTVTSAGLLVKGYFDGCTINGNYEMNGLIVMLKHKATMSGGAKSALASFHRHSSSTGTVDYGLRLFGEVTTGISLETGATNLLQLPAVGTAPVGSNNAGDATFANWVPIAVDIGGTTHYLIAAQTIS